MKYIISTLLSLTATTSAVPGLAPRFAAPVGHEYQAPGPGDVRSPCPGLNSLANHGWINRSGRNITVPQLISGGFAGIGIGQDFMSTIGELALFSPAKPNFQTFDLIDLREHSFPIEHDVSLTRKDYYFDPADSSLTFYKPYYDEFMSYYDGLTTTTVESSAKARQNRILYTLKNNPQQQYGAIAFLFGYGETGLYTMTMGSSPFAQGAPVAYVKSLFLNERLPYELGWQPSTIPITFANLGQYALEVFSSPATTAKLPILGTVLTSGSYRQAVQSQLDLARKLRNETST